MRWASGSVNAINKIFVCIIVYAFNFSASLSMSVARLLFDNMNVINVFESIDVKLYTYSGDIHELNVRRKKWKIISSSNIFTIISHVFFTFSSRKLFMNTYSRFNAALCFYQQVIERSNNVDDELLWTVCACVCLINCGSFKWNLASWLALFTICWSQKHINGKYLLLIHC